MCSSDLATGGLPLSEARKLPSWGEKQEEDIALARELTKTCMGMYIVTPTGLAPEIAHFEISDPPLIYHAPILPSKSNLEKDVPQGEGWKSDFIVKPADAHNLQRPETVESLFYMWRITGDEVYREWGWEMFESFVKWTKVEEEGGFTSVGDVMQIPPPTRDNMESFWLVCAFLFVRMLDGVLTCDRLRRSSTFTYSLDRTTFCLWIRSYSIRKLILSRDLIRVRSASRRGGAGYREIKRGISYWRRRKRRKRRNCRDIKLLQVTIRS